MTFQDDSKNVNGIRRTVNLIQVLVPLAGFGNKIELENLSGVRSGILFLEVKPDNKLEVIRQRI